MATGWHIHIWGITQGVGFRPHVCRLARETGLRGRVRNTPDGVHIDLVADAAVAHRFYNQVQTAPPPGAHLSGSRIEAVTLPAYTDFRIEASPRAGAATVLPTPDVALCSACRAELRDPTDRRYGYAFITCTYCGPRYSILDRLPYDRERTAMAAFTPCPACREEYGDPADRRFHSQTNACADCGPRLSLVVGGKQVLTGDPVAQAVTWLQAGQIGAVKGLGGYLLLCDATQAASIRALRQRKQRPSKPLALQYPDLDTIAGDAHLDPVAATALESAVGPIVLLRPREQPIHALALTDIAPGLGEIGVMLPAAPLLDLLSAGVGRPLVATSGNLSGSPITRTTEEAETALARVADFFLHHDRAIYQPQDDSVLRLTEERRRPVWLRRARGLAPLWKPECSGTGNDRATLAFGSDLKHSYGLRAGGNTYLSQYLGDLDRYESQQAAEESRRRLLDLTGIRPDCIVVDAHPGFHASRAGAALSRALGVPLQTVQHHRAHLAAVLAENDLHATAEEVLGVIWDGTGYGDDGQVWGGEFLAYRGDRIERLAHLHYFPHLLGDKMSREPRLAALSLWRDDPVTLTTLEPLFQPREWQLYTALVQRKPTLQSSSMGRIFDGVAALLGLGAKPSYEGEAAAHLEALARTYLRRAGWASVAEPPWPVADPLRVGDWLAQLAAEYRAGVPAGLLAARVHRQLVALIRTTAERLGYRKLACSGGVWQNTLLIDMADRYLSADFELFFHRGLSPNDENISYGQLHLAPRRSGSSPSSFTYDKSLTHVSGNTW